MAAKKKGARHMREWSDGDMKKLRQFAKLKVSARVAAQKLGRSPGAVRYKAMMEGVSFSSINRKKKSAVLQLAVSFVQPFTLGLAIVSWCEFGPVQQRF